MNVKKISQEDDVLICMQHTGSIVLGFFMLKSLFDIILSLLFCDCIQNLQYLLEILHTQFRGHHKFFYINWNRIFSNEKLSCQIGQQSNLNY